MILLHPKDLVKGQLAGWDQIQLWHMVAPTTIAYLFGMLYLIASFKDYKKSSIFLIVFTTLIHPTIGICIFLIKSIFTAPLFFVEKKVYKNILYDGCFLLITLLSISLLFKTDSTLSTSSFVNQYVYIRHPHHYLMSYSLNLTFFSWIRISGLIGLFFFLKRNLAMTILSGFIFLFFILSFLSQYIATEVIPIEFIVLIGPSRFTAFVSIVIFIQICLAISTLDISKFNKMRFFSRFGFLKKNLMFLTKINLLWFCIIISASTYYITYNPPQQNMKKNEVKVIDWIKKNSNQNEIFLVEEYSIDTFKIRVFANRAVYADDAFPFNKNYINEFTQRWSIYKNLNKLLTTDIKCINNINPRIRYIITSVNLERYKEYTPLFNSGKLYIYDISHFKIPQNCVKIENILKNSTTIS